MPKKQQRPAIGTVMYHVHEHYYCVPGYAAPAIEYSVCSGVVKGFFEGSYVEIKVTGKDPSGFMTPWMYKLSDIGTKCFYTAAEAAHLAKRMAEDYERIWGWLGAPDIPMRRPWQDLLPEMKGTEL